MIRDQPEAVPASSRRDRLERAHEQAHRDFDRAVMTISAGAIGLTVGLVKNIAGGDPVWLPVLALGWSAMGLSLLTIMFSFWTSQKALLSEIDAEGSDDQSSDRVNKWNPWTLRLNFASAILVALGALLFLLFAYRNVGS